MAQVESIAKPDNVPIDDSVENQVKRLLTKASDENIGMPDLVEICKKASTDLTALWNEEQIFEKDFKSMLGALALSVFHVRCQLTHTLRRERKAVGRCRRRVVRGK